MYEQADLCIVADDTFLAGQVMQLVPNGDDEYLAKLAGPTVTPMGMAARNIRNGERLAYKPGSNTADIVTHANVALPTRTTAYWHPDKECTCTTLLFGHAAGCPMGEARAE